MTAIALCMLVGAAPDWSRSSFEKGHGDAFIHYVVFGKVNVEAALSRSKYKSTGLPETIETLKAPASEVAQLAEAFAKLNPDPKLLAAVKAAPEAVIILGTVKDPPTLDYLRNVVGVVQWALDNGGVAVLDPQSFGWFSPKEWNEKFFASGGPEINNHVVILIGEDGWYHTRGLRKFGRPDLSIRKVTPATQKDVTEAFNRFIGLQARGGWIPEGKEVKVGALKGVFAHHAGSIDDPDFNNVHVELVPAPPK